MCDGTTAWRGVSGVLVFHPRSFGTVADAEWGIPDVTRIYFPIGPAARPTMAKPGMRWRYTCADGEVPDALSGDIWEAGDDNAYPPNAVT